LGKRCSIEVIHQEKRSAFQTRTRQVAGGKTIYGFRQQVMGKL
jgi:hypothetical protein